MPDNDDIDFAADAELSVNHNSKGALTAAIQEYVALDAEADALSDDLKKVNAKLKEFKERTLVDLMIALGSSSFVDAVTGKKVDLSTLVSSKLSSMKDDAAREECLKYGESIGGGDLIKTFVTFEFGKGEVEKAKAFASRLYQEGFDNYTFERNVHASSWAAFARERLRNGQEIDCERAGLYSAQVAVPVDVKATTPKVRASTKTRAKK